MRKRNGKFVHISYETGTGRADSVNKFETFNHLFAHTNVLALGPLNPCAYWPNACIFVSDLEDWNVRSAGDSYCITLSNPISESSQDTKSIERSSSEQIYQVADSNI